MHVAGNRVRHCILVFQVVTVSMSCLFFYWDEQVGEQVGEHAEVGHPM